MSATIGMDDPRLERDGSGCDEAAVLRHVAAWRRTSSGLATETLADLLDDLRSPHEGILLGAEGVRLLTATLLARAVGGELSISDARMLFASMYAAAPDARPEHSEEYLAESTARGLLIALLLALRVGGGPT